MTIIWGLDLKEIQWHKFKASYMFTPIYYLRRTKMVLYQLAMILCVCSESTGTSTISDYVNQQSTIEDEHPGVSVYNNNLIGIASYNIFVGVSVATVIGAAFFFDLFWPERSENKPVRLGWKICTVVISVMMLSTALTMTIITATRSVSINGTDPTSAGKLWEEITKKPALTYRTNPKAIASVVLAWLGFVATVASTVVLFAFHRHDARYGPRSAYGRRLNDRTMASGGVEGLTNKDASSPRGLLPQGPSL